MRILAFDPGYTTGYVEAEASSDDFDLTRAGQISWADRFVALQDLLQSMPQPAYVVVESFRLYAHKAKSQINNEFPSVRVIGAIEAYLADKLLLNRLVFQPAASIARVQILPQHVAALRYEHARDAYKHLRYFWVTRIKHEQPT